MNIHCSNPFPHSFPDPIRKVASSEVSFCRNAMPNSSGGAFLTCSNLLPVDKNGTYASEYCIDWK